MADVDFELDLPTQWPVPGERTIREILEARADSEPDHVFCRWDGGEITIGALDRAATRLANALLSLGLKRGDLVALMLEHHVEHIIAIFALAKVGIIRTAINTAARGDSLSLLLADAKPAALIAESQFADVLAPALESTPVPHVVWRDEAAPDRPGGLSALIAESSEIRPAIAPDTDDIIAMNYTSGTTGAPKKFGRSDRVVQIGSLGCLMISCAQPGDIWLFWEPLHHGAGSQVAFAAVMEKITLALVPRFSASRFFDQARQFKTTKIHYIGGVLPILMKQPLSPDDRRHHVTHAWGAGCPADVAEAFSERFGVIVNEGYGLSEVANYVSINLDGPSGSIGRVLPWFELRIVDEAIVELPAGTAGEIVVKGKSPLFTSRSFNKKSVTTPDGWIRTGDLGRLDEEGNLYFAGRRSDSLRRRGENISAWEVERIVNQHPLVEECALIGVPSGLGAGDDDLKLFIKPTEPLDPLALIQWCETRMPYFQVPRYVALIDAFPKTASQRIRKGELPRSTADCWDLERSGYKFAR